MLGVALAVAVLIIVMSVINGFETELERRILSVSPDARLIGYDDGTEVPVDDWVSLRNLALARDDVLAAAPFVEGQGLVQSGDRLLGVSIRGVDPTLEAGVSTLGEHMIAGSYAALEGRWNVLLGSDLAATLGVVVGDRLMLGIPTVSVTPAGILPTSRQFTVAGIFSVGMAEFDRGLVVIGFDDAARLFRTGGRASGISLKVDDLFEARAIVQSYANDVAARFRLFYAYEDWSWRHSNVFKSIELTKPTLFIILSLVISIAAFNIVSTLIMVVREKRGDIAILRSIGAAPRSILGIFVVQGSSIGALGVIGGLALGLALVASLGTIVGWIEGWFAIDLLSADVYLIGDLPTEARTGEIVRILAMAFALAVLATIYPAYRAATQPPAEALRNE